MPTLTPFDGNQVVGATIKITNASDGLSKAMKVDPKEFHHDERVYVVLECVTRRVQFDKVADESDDLVRVHVLKAGLATVVDQKLVAKVLAAQRALLDAAEGKQSLDGMDGM